MTTAILLVLTMIVGRHGTSPVLLSENFNPTGYQLTWTETISGGTLDEDSVAGAPGTGFATQWLLIDRGGTAGTGTAKAVTAIRTTPVAYARAYYDLRAYGTCPEVGGGSSYVDLFAMLDASSNDLARLRVRYTCFEGEGLTYIDLYLGGVLTASYDVTAQSTGRVELSLSNSADTYALRIDGVSVASGSSAVSADIAQFQLGGSVNASTSLRRIYAYQDAVVVRSDTWPGSV